MPGTNTVLCGLIRQIVRMLFTSASVAERLVTDCCAWIAQVDGLDIGFSLANRKGKSVFGMFVKPNFEGRGVSGY